MNVAEQYPARTDDNGVTWFRPVRDAGSDFSQWGWTSQREQAHPDYRATERPAEVRPLPGGGFAFVPVDPLPAEPLGPLPAEFIDVGYVDETTRGPHTIVHTATRESAQCAGPAGCLPCRVAEKEAPAHAKAQECADAYGRALSQLFELAATIDDTQGALW
ncbi:hypothetical protein CL76_gp28 [Mycobacterium phage Larva]|uniref:Uncharacterized protein n=1 Tax=Mycobacterium phage Larva TaxID=2922990 RepID=G1FMX6_9CAUD|nr:hypothetical protein CL76_gp28 [Mycobacterium phage Larva]AEL19722.1 hypothetical protein LARVA_74 [Mycobacterium phage Larva]